MYTRLGISQGADWISSLSSEVSQYFQIKYECFCIEQTIQAGFWGWQNATHFSLGTERTTADLDTNVIATFKIHSVYLCQKYIQSLWLQLIARLMSCRNALYLWLLSSPMCPQKVLGTQSGFSPVPNRQKWCEMGFAMGLREGMSPVERKWP